MKIPRVRRSGFTLLEIILYVTLTSILMVAMMRSIVTILEHDEVTTSRETVQQQLRIVMEAILHDMRESMSVNVASSTLSNDQGSITLNFEEADRHPTSYRLMTGAINVQKNNGEWKLLTGTAVTVQQLRFEKKSSPNASPVYGVTIKGEDPYFDGGFLTTKSVTVRGLAAVRRKLAIRDPRVIFGENFSSDPYIFYGISSTSSSSGGGGGGSSSSGGGGCTPDPAPSCNSQTATVYVDSCGDVSGGPDDGNTYVGTLTGTSGNDIMVGTSGVDNINGGSGNDTICALSGNDTVSGEGGSDTIFGGGGADILNGDGSGDTICGEDGFDTITGGSDADSLDGGAGTDTLDGESGTDICRKGETNSNCEDTSTAIATCGTGPASSAASSSSSANSSSTPAGSSASSASSGGSSAPAGGSSSSCTPGAAPTCNGQTATVYVDNCNVINGGPNNGNNYTGTLTGTSSNDYMVGTSSNDYINGAAGNDTICALAGNDTVDAGAGDDVVFGGNGDDIIDGENNDDTLCGEAGTDTITGGNHADKLDGGAGTDNLDGENQSDICRKGETLTSCEDTTSAITVCGTPAAGGGSSSASSTSSFSESVSSPSSAPSSASSIP